MSQAKEPDGGRELSISPLGEGAILLNVGSVASIERQECIWSVASEAWHWPHVRDVVPGMNNLTILFDPQHGDVDRMTLLLRAAWNGAAAIGRTGRLVDIPVAYGGEYGPDIGMVSDHTGLTIAEIVERHAGGDYVVYFLGFQPGFAYIGGLDPLLATPRRAEPRVAVPAGSVGIGGIQTGIYPAASPGGWQLIGRTNARLFDPSADPPTLLQPGDRVRFIATQVLS